MRAIAELAMRGRVYAGAIALLGTLLPFVTPAVVALVTLRKGAVEGTIILLVGLLPTLMAFGGDSAQINGAQTDGTQILVFMLTVLGMAAIYLSAWVLRQTASLSSMLMSLLLLSVGSLLLMKQLIPSYLQHLVDSLSQIYQQMEEQMVPGVDVPPVGINETSLMGSLGVIIMLNGICSVFLGRWWQSLLYNPGGFGADFHQFRLSPALATICLMISVYFLVQGDVYLTWSFMFALPLMLVAIAIVHAVVKPSKNAKQWLVLFYVAFIALSVFQFAYYVQIVLMGIGFLDHWLNFRNRSSQAA